MAKKSQIDRAIDALEAKRSDLTAKYNVEAGALESAITALRAQKVRSRPKAVTAAVDKSA